MTDDSEVHDVDDVQESSGMYAARLRLPFIGY